MAKKKEDSAPKTMSNRRKPEQKEHSSNIINGIIPYVISKLDVICPLAEKYLTEESITKDEWTSLKDIVQIVIDEYYKDEEHIMFSTFNRDKMGIRYKESHASYYMAISLQYMKHLLHQVDIYRKYVDTNKDIADNAIYVASMHLYYFITCPEKI